MTRIFFFVPYLAAGFIVTIMLGVLYASVQQTYRSGANDPQLQIARDIHASLARGVSVNKYLSDTIDLEKSLSAFATLCDSKGQPIQSSGFLNGQFPRLPVGVFEFAKAHGEDVLTWQPRSGVRMATVVLHNNMSPVEYIIVGRSLQEVEIREHNLLVMVSICWVIAMGVIMVAGWLQYVSRKQHSF
ncbi:MAG TPA: hypothetical protein VMH01_05850 [Puia sp.]|nr:hypothetical protein [Puia sp.]